MTETISTGNLKKDFGRMAHNELANQADIDFWRTKFEAAREAYIKAGVELDEVHLVLSSTENANEIIQLQLDDRDTENKVLRALLMESYRRFRFIGLNKNGMLMKKLLSVLGEDAETYYTAYLGGELASDGCLKRLE